VLDRAALRNIVLADPAALKRLEKIMHPLVRRAQKDFCSAATRQQRRAILLDIPLLFESGTGRARKKTSGGGAAKKNIAGGAAKKKMDLTLTVSCPRDVQINRVKARGKMSPEQIATIIAKQMPDTEKRRRADVTLRTGLSRFHTLRTVRRLVKDLL
jgi:dephospho-CoA kinase